jgi:TerB N-terminal domain
MKRQRNTFFTIVKVVLAIWILFLIFGTLSSAIEGDGVGIAMGIILLLISITLWLVLARSRSKRLQKGKPGTLDKISIQGGIQRSSPSVPTGNSTEQDRFVEIVQGGKPEKKVPAITVSIHYETGGSLFLKEAQRFHDQEGKSAEPVPFMQYWPTYSALNQAQTRWYFYWRSEIRRGNYLPTDLSYIFLHVYETLNLVENPDPDLASQRIWYLWQNYRTQHPKLDNYLPDWGGWLPRN